MPDWEVKIQELRKHGAWWLPDDWETHWNSIDSIADYLKATLAEGALFRFTDNTQVYIHQDGMMRGDPNLMTFMTFGKYFSDVKTLFAGDRSRYTFGKMLPSA